jgi:hypothetical protein
VGGIAFVAVLSVVGTVAWSLLNRSDHVPPLPLAEGPALGDLTGYVGRIDPGARTIDIAEDLSGLRSVAMVVTDDTSIMVGDKRGGIGDLSKDLPVRAFYEVRNDVTYVTSIQVIIDEAKGTAAATTPAVAPPPPPRGRPPPRRGPPRRRAGRRPLRHQRPRSRPVRFPLRRGPPRRRRRHRSGRRRLRSPVLPRRTPTTAAR